MLTADRCLSDALASVAEVAARLSQRLGAPPAVAEALAQGNARWDGPLSSSLPSREGLLATGRLVHLVHLVHVAQTYARVGGAEAADAIVRQRSGTEFDPALARLWLEYSHELLGQLEVDSLWDHVLDVEPGPPREVGPVHLDEVSRALADCVDLLRHTRADTPREWRAWPRMWARELGLDAEEVDTDRRAALVHDLGQPCRRMQSTIATAGWGVRRVGVLAGSLGHRALLVACAWWKTTVSLGGLTSSGRSRLRPQTRDRRPVVTPRARRWWPPGPAAACWRGGEALRRPLGPHRARAVRARGPARRLRVLPVASGAQGPLPAGGGRSPDAEPEWWDDAARASCTRATGRRFCSRPPAGR